MSELTVGRRVEEVVWVKGCAIYRVAAAGVGNGGSDGDV